VTPTDDDADVARVLAGQPDAFDGIVRRWQGPLVNLAYRFCRDRSRAEDMAQEAFIRAFRALASWRGESLFSTWLFALAANVYRSELRRLPPPPTSLDLVREPGSDARYAGDLEEAARDRVLHHTVATLPAKYRDALVVFYFHEMNVATAAKTLKLPEGTLKARLSRARDLLRRKLTGVLS